MVQIGWRGHRHLLSIDDFSREELETIFNATNILHQYSNEGTQLPLLKGFILKPAFFEPSSRTQNSFEAAMLIMGGSTLSSHSPAEAKWKGETDEDIITSYVQYADFIIIRHPQPNSVKNFAKILDSQDNRAKIINAGDGPNEHPTQALTDLYTVMKEFGTLDGVTYVFLGDLKYSRTVHSLILGAKKFNGIRFIGFPVSGLNLPEEYTPTNYEQHDITKLSQFLRSLDPNSCVVIYTTRTQWERIARERYNFDELDEGTKTRIRTEIYKEINCQVTREHLDSSPTTTILLDPLPRISQISDELFYSNHPKLIAIKQMRYGLSVRMAILGLFAGKEEEILSLRK